MPPCNSFDPAGMIPHHPRDYPLWLWMFMDTLSLDLRERLPSDATPLQWQLLRCKIEYFLREVSPTLLRQALDRPSMLLPDVARLLEERQGIPREIVYDTFKGVLVNELENLLAE